MRLRPRLLTILGALLVVVAMVMHIVSMATPDLFQIDMIRVFDEINDTITGSKDVNEEDVQHFQQLLEGVRSTFGTGSRFHFGLFKLCSHFNLTGNNPASPLPFKVEFDVCFGWDNNFAQNFTMERSGWLKGVTGSYISALVFIVIALVLTNNSVHTASKGDRRRILPKFICLTLSLAVVALLIGNIILLANYASEQPAVSTFLNTQNHQEKMERIENVLRQRVVKLMELGGAFPLALASTFVLLLAANFFLLVGRASQRNMKETGMRRFDDESEDQDVRNGDITPL